MRTPIGNFPATIVALALTFHPQLPTVLARPAVTGIAAGGLHSLFSKSDGSVWVVGNKDSRQLGIGIQPGTSISAGAAGYLHSLYKPTETTLPPLVN